MSAILQPKGQKNPAMDIPLRTSRGFEEIRVTPELAQHWLTFNTINRTITNSRVEQYKSDMQAGRWAENGEPIIFAYGRLLDGQHRLLSIIQSGVTARMLIVFGVDPEVASTINTARGRTPRDVLSIEGLDKWCSSTLGAAVHTIMAYETGRAIYSSIKFTNQEIRNYYLEHQGAIEQTVRACKAYPRRRPVVPLARVMALHYIFSKHSSEMADKFFDKLAAGIGVEKDTPVFQLRKVLEADVTRSQPRASYSQLFMVVRAWNAFRRGSKLSSPSSLYPRDGDSFPEII